MKMTLRLAVWAAALLVCAAAFADRVTMRDGRVFDGVIKEESRTAIVLETVVANIRTTMTLNRREIASIERGVVTELPEAAAPSREAPSRARPGARPETRQGAPARGGVTRYITVPIEGAFGDDVAPAGVRESLEHATRRGVRHIVFHIKSPGGDLWAAEEIMEIMREFSPNLHYTAVVKEAISAAIWVVFGCDEIYMAPGSSIGAAVIYSTERTTGNKEVDAKFNSAIAGKVASMAESKGHSGAIVRAMMLQEAEAYAVEDEPGVFRIVDERPSRDGEHVTMLADKQRVLTLTAEEAVRYGLAKVGPIGAGREGWTKHSEFGEAAMRWAREALASTNPEKLIEELNAHADVCALALRDAERNSPELIPLFHSGEAGLLTPQTRKLWQERTAASIAAIDRALQALNAYERVQDRLRKLGIEGGSHELNVRELRLQLQNRREHLWSNRNRAYV